MGVVPVTIRGVFYPDGKSADDKPKRGTMVGYAWVTGLGVGGGPVIPPAELPPPGQGAHPSHPIVEVPTHPIELPPDTPSPPDIPTVPSEPKPPPPSGGWGWSPTYGWGYFPGSGGAGPKK